NQVPVNNMYGAIYYVAATSNVYVVANDPLAATGSNKTYLKGGHLNSDGSISFGPLTTRQVSGTIGGGIGGCYAGFNVDVTLVGNETTGGLIWTCDAKNTSGPNNRTSALGEANVTASTSAALNIGNTLWAPDATAAVNETTLAKQFATLAPINDAGA